MSRRYDLAIRLGRIPPRLQKLVSIGQVFGRLTIVALVPKPEGASVGRYWLGKCECGNEVICTTGRLNHGKVKSCGCLHRDTARKLGLASRKHPIKTKSAPTPVVDQQSVPAQILPVGIGSVFGRLVVSQFLEVDQWLCRCDCGRWKVIRKANLARGHTKSCGCWQRESTTARPNNLVPLMPCVIRGFGRR